MTSVEQLFDEFAVRFRRGERPDLRAYLARAGDGAEELAALVDVFLQAAPAPDAGEEALALSRAWVEGESPLLALRTRRGLRRGEVVAALVERLGLKPATREQVRRRYHELESGLLDVKRVDRRVWEALAAILQTAAADLRAWRPQPPPPSHAAAYFRREEARFDLLVEPTRARAPAREPDEVDRLFGVE